MFARCLSCHRPFDANESLERLRTGRRIAYDPDRGRLWTVCDACRRWTLAPIEERWETLEELERLTRDRGRLLASTDHVGLVEVEDLEVVRVGRTQLREEAWWRYGSELLRRRRSHQVNQFLEWGAIVAFAVATGGAAFYWGQSGNLVSNAQRWFRFGGVAWRGRVECGVCGGTLERIRFRDTRRLSVDAPFDAETTLTFPCPTCRRSGRRDPGSSFRLAGVEAEHVLQRVLSYRNFVGGGEKHVRSATDLIEAAGSASAFIEGLARRHGNLGEVGSVKKNLSRSLALEIAVNDDSERRLLRLELAAIEARWREEEEIAAIIDGELTPLPAGRSPGPVGGGS